MGVDLVDITAKQAELTPERIAFEDVVSGRTLNYRELDDRASRCAAYLSSVGVEHGDRVAILCRNRIEFFETMFACAKPPAEIERPGTAFRWSVTVSEGRSSICAAVTTEIGFGES